MTDRIISEILEDKRTITRVDKCFMSDGEMVEEGYTAFHPETSSAPTRPAWMVDKIDAYAEPVPGGFAVMYRVWKDDEIICRVPVWTYEVTYQKGGDGDE